MTGPAGDAGPPAWVADPSAPWRILLSARLRTPRQAADLHATLSRLFDDQAWPGVPEVVAHDDPEALRVLLAGRDRAPVVLGVAGSEVVVSAHHSYVDGLGLLAVLAAVTGGPVSSTARGVADRPREGSFSAVAARRLAEVALRPPARVVAPGAPSAEGDVLVQQTTERTVRTAELVHAGVSAVVAHNARHGRPSRHVAVAIGAGRPADGARAIADRSQLLRLRDLEGRSLPEIEQLVRQAPTQPPPAARGAASSRLLEAALRLLAPRLGSTLLVSHLGEVSAPEVAGLAFHPVTVGGTGLSLGAVGRDGVTTLGLRARAADWDATALQLLLDDVVRALAP
ncbi:hypothetical protein [Nocardioides dongkuii]|uniref:hypothetical protein n=1 Tax=Nocardioides dongkuii TaxID=2760089 RepID=UPI0015FB5425|nr:hypothetical protein [Nocardioides dongkuii]